MERQRCYVVAFCFLCWCSEELGSYQPVASSILLSRRGLGAIDFVVLLPLPSQLRLLWLERLTRGEIA